MAEAKRETTHGLEGRVSRKVRRINRRAVLLGAGAMLAGVAASAADKARSARVVYEVSLVVAPGAEPDEFVCRAFFHSPESGRVHEVQACVRCGDSITLRAAEIRPDGSTVEATVHVSADTSGQQAHVTTQVMDRGRVVRVKSSSMDLPRR